MMASAVLLYMSSAHLTTELSISQSKEILPPPAIVFVLTPSYISRAYQIISRKIMTIEPRLYPRTTETRLYSGELTTVMSRLYPRENRQ